MAMAASTSETAAGTCTFTPRNYAVGDVWYPRLGQREALHCVACICQEVWQKNYQYDIWLIIEIIKINF
jgi:hypothetical protein